MNRSRAQHNAALVAHTALPRALPHHATVRFTSTFSWGGRTLNLAVYLRCSMMSDANEKQNAQCCAWQQFQRGYMQVSYSSK